MISKSMMIGQLPIELTLIICSYFECSHVYRVMAMVFNVTFYNMSVIIVAISFIDGGNDKPIIRHWQTLSLKVVSSTPRH